MGWMCKTIESNAQAWLQLSDSNKQEKGWQINKSCITNIELVGWLETSLWKYIRKLKDNHTNVENVWEIGECAKTVNKILMKAILDLWETGSLLHNGNIYHRNWIKCHFVGKNSLQTCHC